MKKRVREVLELRGVVELRGVREVHRVRKTEIYRSSTEKALNREHNFSDSIGGIEQEAGEGVVVVAAVAEEAAGGQHHIHPVPSVQLNGHRHTDAVLLILHVPLTRCSQDAAIAPETGTSCQRGTWRASVAVDGESQAVDTSTGRSEDTGGCAVAVTQVEKD